MTNSADIHATITNQLIAAIERDPGRVTLPWRRAAGGLHLPVNAATKQSYNGINILSLWVAADSLGYATPQWATYRQWLSLGGQVRKGEKASSIVFYKEFEVETEADSDDDGKRRMARASSVFNAAQVDGIEISSGDDLPDLGPVERLRRADEVVRSTGASILHGGDRAYFSPKLDRIQMPDEKLFTGSETMTRTEGYYATLLHELVHWTGGEPRLNRQMGKRFGDQAYAAEELVAEIGAAFLCAELGVTPELRDDHARYIADWLKLLKSGAKAIFTAAARASEAAKFLKAKAPA